MSLHSLLQTKLPPEKLLLLPKGFEVIGDIAIISIPPALEDEKYIIAEAFSFLRKDVKTILRKLHKIEGTARVADFELLLGERTTQCTGRTAASSSLMLQKHSFLEKCTMNGTGSYIK